MERSDQGTLDQGAYDPSVLRTRMEIEDIQLRRPDRSPSALRLIRRGLRRMHTLEIAAANIYRFQTTSEVSELNRQLIAAMCNEMTHIQDFQVKLLEHGWKPGRVSWIYWMVGFILGTFSRWMGAKSIIKTGIWLETKAVEGYDELLQTVDWDEDTRRVIRENQLDEYEHIRRWKAFLQP